VYLYTTPKTWIDDVTLTYEINTNGDGIVHYNVSILPKASSTFEALLIDADGNTVAKGSALSGSLTVPSSTYLQTKFHSVFYQTK
jgi:hypothetical protein